MHEREPPLLAALAGGGQRIVDGHADQAHGGAERRSRFHLGDRSGLRHEHLASHTALARRVRQRLSVIAGASRDHSVRAGIAQRRDLRERAPQFEGAGALKVLGLQRDGRADAVAECARAQNGRVAIDTGSGVGGAAYVRQRNRHARGGH